MTAKTQFAVLGATLLIASRCFALDLSGTIFEKAGKRFNVDPDLLYSISLVESAVTSEELGRNYINPSPYALRTNKPYYPRTRTDASKLLKQLLRTNKSVDVGLCQINTTWHGHRVPKLSDLLDPQINVNVAAKILSECIDRNPNDAVAAIGAYHTSDPVRAKRYARTVLRIYTRVKEFDLNQAKRNLRGEVISND